MLHIRISRLEELSGAHDTTLAELFILGYLSLVHLHFSVGHEVGRGVIGLLPEFISVILSVNSLFVHSFGFFLLHFLIFIVIRVLLRH
jgi:hypothetical protein